MSWTVSNPKSSAEIAQILISFKQIPSATDQGFQQRLAEQTNKTAPLYFSSYEPDCPQSSFETSKPALFKQTHKERGHQSKGKPPLTTSKKSMTAVQTNNTICRNGANCPFFSPNISTSSKAKVLKMDMAFYCRRHFLSQKQGWYPNTNTLKSAHRKSDGKINIMCFLQ